MDSTYYWSIVLILGLGTFLIRASFIYLSKYLNLSERTLELFTFIPAAVFPALFIPMAFFHEGQVELFHQKERFIALLIAVVVSFKVRHIIGTILCGLFSLYLLQGLF